MSPNSQPLPHRCLRPASRLQSRRGFTLFEVVVAAFVIVLALLGVIGTCIMASDLSADARHRDQARAILQSLASEFQRLTIDDPAGDPFPFFTTTTAPTGAGLTWDGGNLSADGLALEVRLGSDPSAPLARITRAVSELDETDGTPNTDTTPGAAGKMLVATFSATYSVKGKQKTETLTIARSDP